MRNNINIPVIINKESYIASKVAEGIPSNVSKLLANVTQCKRDHELTNALMAYAYNVAGRNLLFAILFEINIEKDIHGLCLDFELDKGSILKLMSSVNQSQLFDDREYDKVSDTIFDEQSIENGVKFVEEGLYIQPRVGSKELDTYHNEINTEPNHLLTFREFSLEEIEDYIRDPLSIEDCELLDLIVDGYSSHIDFMFKKLVFQMNKLMDTKSRNNVVDDLFFTTSNNSDMTHLMYAHYESFLKTIENWNKIHEQEPTP